MNYYTALIHKKKLIFIIYTLRGCTDIPVNLLGHVKSLEYGAEGLEDVLFKTTTPLIFPDSSNLVRDSLKKNNNMEISMRIKNELYKKSNLRKRSGVSSTT